MPTAKPYKVHVRVCGTDAGAYEFATVEEARADMESRWKYEVLGCHYRLSGPCPICKGVPAHPEIKGCEGCMGCDFTGTVEGFDEMERLDALAHAANPHRAHRFDDDDSHLT